MRTRKPPSSTKLDPLISTYGTPSLRWRDLWFRFLPSILVVLAPLVYGLWRAWYGYTQFGPAAGISWGHPWFLISTITLVPLLWLAWRRVRATRRMVKIYQHGLRILGSGRRNRAFLWRHLDGIATRHTRDHFLWIPTREHFQVTLHPHIGLPVRLDPRIPNLAELSARIKGKIYPRLLKEYREQRLAGKNLYFGPIVLGSTGLNMQKGNYPWEQITRIDVQHGTLIITLKDHHPQKISVGEIPNIELLIQIIQEGIPS